MIIRLYLKYFQTCFFYFCFSHSKKKELLIVCLSSFLLFNLGVSLVGFINLVKFLAMSFS
ncbi:hypothetical protein M6B38_301435 [Iris pallida]|uniref:Uncharacterized protein n=1 Tax=Iris pallida TaxID=29817 RepID=A0AAX6HNS7_IRIPA|nr:hypothetical protein M6B38_301435 [Iris pallida]